MAFLFVVCGALRLARFNVQKSSVDGRYFVGLPIPAAAAPVAALVNVSPAAVDERTHAVLWLSLLIVLAFLMVSTFRYTSFKKVDLKSRRSYVNVVGIARAPGRLQHAPGVVPARPGHPLLALGTPRVRGRARLPAPRRPAARRRRQRGALTGPAASRTRPDRPYVGRRAASSSIDGRVVLIRRGKEPLRGRWVIPGGTVELGETLQEALVREMQEETGLVVRPREVVLVFDRIQREGPTVEYHYVIVDYALRLRVGRAAGGVGRGRGRARGPARARRLRPAAAGPGPRAGRFPARV